MKGYKGFDKDLKCRGFQYEVGGEYEEPEVKICEKGFHFCENPMDVLKYYSPSNSRYAEVEGDGKIETHEDDKICCSKLRIKTEIGLSGLIQAGVKFILDKVDWKNAAATSTGTSSAATNTGTCSAATNTGACSTATNTGAYSVATNTGAYSAATVEGRESVAISLGIEGKAKGALGCWLVLAEWERLEDGWHRTDVKCGLVDGDNIKPDTYYVLKNGEFVEVCEEDIDD